VTDSSIRDKVNGFLRDFAIGGRRSRFFATLISLPATSPRWSPICEGHPQAKGGERNV
jgi:hypothetical protein